MLSNLYIENVAVIEKAEIDFQKGFNVLTGETGAGKSIIIDSINAVLGNRTSRDVIRTGEKSAFISAAFRCPGAAALSALRELGFEMEEDTLLLQREIRQDGNLCKINGRPASVSVLRTLAPFLLSIQGQHESYELLSQDTHMGYIDAFGELNGFLHEYRLAYDKLRHIAKDLDATEMDEEEKQRKIDLLTFQIGELEDASIRPGESDELADRKKMILNCEKISDAISCALRILSGEEDENGAEQGIEEAASSIEEAAKFMPELQTPSQTLREMSYGLRDCVSEIRRYGEDVLFDPKELEEIEDRLELLYRLGMKYGKSEEEMLAFLEHAKEELQTIRLSDERRAVLSAEYEEAKSQAIRLARELSEKRKETASAFETGVMEELRFLNMPSVRFEVQRERCPLNMTGCDKMQFMISVNAGEDVKPIAKIASGGELSRIMLAVKTVLSGKDDTDTLIFDEVDTGISGSAAQKVGKKLRQASVSRQVICVTHLPQIASLADNQYLICKSEENGKTYTKVLLLDFEGRKKEIARMIGGERITAVTLQNAQEMLLSEA